MIDEFEIQLESQSVFYGIEIMDGSWADPAEYV